MNRLSLFLGLALALVPARAVVAGLEWQAGSGFRSAALAVPVGGKTGFTILPPTQTGVAFTNALAEDHYLTNQILLNGSGVAAGDGDGDGLCDLYFCGLDGSNAFYRNLGNWRFEDITASAGVACADQPSSGAVLADVDGDGDLDLLVNGVGTGTRLFLNDGHARFTETTRQAGLLGGTGATSMALADIDGDGDLDLYVVNYRTTTFRDEPPKRYSVATANGKFELVAVDSRPLTASDLKGRFSVNRETGVLENGEADVLYRNDGHGHFTPVDWTDGTFLDEDGKPMAVPYDWGLSAMFHDLNGDGAPDLYVCDDFHSPDRIWINDGQGRFRAIPRLAVRQTSIFSMGLDIADVDRDGHDDFFVADMFSRQHARRQVQLMERQPMVLPVGRLDDRPQYSRNTLFFNRGDGTFAEIAQYVGVEASDWTWCPVFLDVDLDGFEDLLCITGHVRDAQNIDIARRIDALTHSQKLSWTEQLRLRRLFQPLNVPNYAFRNRGDLTFQEVSHAWGFDSLKVSQGVALADLDNDGDLDVVVNCLNDSPILYRNDSTHPRVSVRLRGRPANTEGVGARIAVSQAGLLVQSQEIMAGGRYLSSDQPMRVFAATSTNADLTIRVRWRSGQESVVAQARANRLYEIDEAGATAVPANTAPTEPPPFFSDVSELIGHRHHEEPFDDFQQQPLLPHKFSQLGPGVSWYDFDGDGWDDLIIGSGRGGRLSVFHNDGEGGFAPFREVALDAPVARDQTTVLGWQRAPGQVVLLAGSANYEDGRTNGAVVAQYDLGAKTVDESLPGQRSSTGPLAMGDVDGDGDLDLFVGGRVIAGRCPEPASSLIFRNDAGALHLDSEASRAFADAGLVSGAVFTDLDGDGFPELVLACEWGPVRIFQNDKGRFQLRDFALTWPANIAHPSAARLSQMTGWWNSVAAGDFDGDGRMDLIAGNWGCNTKYQSQLSAPLHTHYGDLNDDGFVEILEAYADPDLKKIVPFRDWGTLSQSMPFILDRFDSYTAFSTAGVSEILGDRMKQVKDLPVVTLDSVVLLNRQDHFEVRPLPREAQFAPVFGLAVADFDGDGREDVFASQNFFAVAPLTSRCDAGLGVWLKGDGKGQFAAVPARASGLYVYGEGRGAAVCDFDHDGRVDLAVGQNGEATRLFHNRGAKPGLRVRLRGPAGNPQGIGAVVRVVYADASRGPAREIHAGSGYWSQDSAVSVLGLTRVAAAVWVRWPAGAKEIFPLPSGVASVVVTPKQKAEAAP